MAKVSTAATVASDVPKAANDLDQAHDRHGKLKKCDPDEARRILARLRQRVIGMEEVLDARIAVTPSSDATSPKIARLISSRSVAASITEIAGREWRRLADRCNARQRCICRGSVQLAAFDGALEALGNARLAFFGERDIDIAQQHVETGLCGHLRNARAHLARTDHTDRSHVSSPFKGTLPLPRQVHYDGADDRPVSRFLLVSAMLAASLAARAQTPAPPTIPAPAAAGPVAGAPILGRLRIFDDWAVACDNRLSCSAVSLLPQGRGRAIFRADMDRPRR